MRVFLSILYSYSATTITGVSQTKLINQITGHNNEFQVKLCLEYCFLSRLRLIQSSLVGFFCFRPVTCLVTFCFSDPGNSSRTVTS